MFPCVILVLQVLKDYVWMGYKLLFNVYDVNLPSNCGVSYLSVRVYSLISLA